ncbi:hypothetical protein [Mesorhizobium sp. SARCC-RB16n]|uniref:hypothetical protein n=1 Tax=Mesorhizobium sp. SARCC-RB16n TaxID=2116687 RepID=UPI001AEE97D4|nr:hypothetical protein [Mesorhizobium sp. SARCC-RB16n]
MIDRVEELPELLQPAGNPRIQAGGDRFSQGFEGRDRRFIAVTGQPAEQSIDSRLTNRIRWIKVDRARSAKPPA